MFSFQNMLKCILHFFSLAKTHIHPKAISYGFIHIFSTLRGCFNVTGITEFSISWFGGCRALLHHFCSFIPAVSPPILYCLTMLLTTILHVLVNTIITRRQVCSFLCLYWGMDTIVVICSYQCS